MAAPEKEPQGPLERREEAPSPERQIKGVLDIVEHELPEEPITDGATGQTVLTPTDAQTPQITLPLTQEEIREGLGHPITDSVSWFARWCLRMWEKALAVGKKVFFRGQAR